MCKTARRTQLLKQPLTKSPAEYRKEICFCNTTTSPASNHPSPHNRAGDTGRLGGGHAPYKKKNGTKRKKEIVSKQKLLKGCHQGQNFIVIVVLERLQFKIFS